MNEKLTKSSVKCCVEDSIENSYYIIIIINYKIILHYLLIKSVLIRSSSAPLSAQASGSFLASIALINETGKTLRNKPLVSLSTRLMTRKRSFSDRMRSMRVNRRMLLSYSASGMVPQTAASLWRHACVAWLHQITISAL